MLEGINECLSARDDFMFWRQYQKGKNSNSEGKNRVHRPSASIK